MKPLILVLFAQEYDELGLDPLIAGHDDYEFVREGFDFFTFPQNARILWFDVERFVDELAHKYRERRVAAVVSTHEQFGALAASLLTARLGLPSTPLKALLTAQHKFLARQIHSRALPDHVPPFCGFRYDADITRAVTIAYPIFVKPVKAAFSVLAKRCADEAALREHLRFRLWEKIIIKRLTWPFRRVSRKHLDCEIDADCFIAEGCVDDALQVCVDGYAHAGRVNILGTVDSVMYPGTSAFMRFEYPSRLDADVVARLEDIARRAVEAIGFTHGLFNVELFYQPASGRITIIEINPRMAGQFSDLYERVDGKSLWSLELDLALGRTDLAQLLVARHVIMRRRGPDRDLLARHGDTAQSVDMGEVDQVRRRGKPRLHGRNQRHATRQELGVPLLGELASFGDRLGAVIVDRIHGRVSSVLRCVDGRPDTLGRRGHQKVVVADGVGDGVDDRWRRADRPRLAAALDA